MIVVHHLNNSRSQRVLWLLEELGLAYDIKRYQRDKKTMLAPPELRKVHPLGKSPVLTDGDLTLPSRVPSLNTWSSVTATAALHQPESCPPTCATATGCTMPKAR